MKNLKFQTRILVISIILSLCFTLCSNCLADEGPSYLLFLLNKTGYPFLLTANVNLGKNIMEVEYLPSNTAVTVKVNIAEVLNNFKDLKLIGSFEIKNIQFDGNEDTKKIQYINKGFKKGTILVVWKAENKGELSQLEKQNILNRVEAIYWEQRRLSYIGAYKNSKTLLYEATKNYQE